MRISDWSSDVCSSDLTKGGEEITPHIHSPRKFNMFRRRAPTAAVRAGEIVMPYLYNAWYCAGWSADLGAAPTGIRMLDMAVVLYRRADCDPVSVSGLCPHRFAPLSLGRVGRYTLVCALPGWRSHQAGTRH